MVEYPPYPLDDRIILKPEIPKDKILVWKKDLDRRTVGYSPESQAHPAKMHLFLTQWIIKNLTLEGEVIVDPMAGIGSTILEAARLGRNAIGVEFEQKFVDWGNENIGVLKKQAVIGRVGSAKIIQGDSRELTTILSGYVDGIVMSPPFSKSPRAGNKDKDKFWDNAENRHKRNFTKHGSRRILDSMHYSEDKDNIGNLEYGKNIDAIVMSPPFSKANTGGGIAKKGYEGKHGKDDKLHQRHERQFTEDKDNISNLPHGEIDAIIPSPPHGNRLSDDRVDDGDADRMSYRQTIKGDRERQMCVENGIDPSTYSKDKANVGNLKGKNYLSEMFKVYEQCYSVLKPGGRAVIVTKNFTRNWKQVRLDMDTIRLMEKSGFRLVDRYFREITHPSFWILNYRKRCKEKGVPDPTAHYEDVLVFAKGG